MYDFGGLDVSDDANEEINSWDNFTEKILGFLDTLPNHVRIQLDTVYSLTQDFSKKLLLKPKKNLILECLNLAIPFM